MPNCFFLPPPEKFSSWNLRSICRRFFMPISSLDSSSSLVKKFWRVSNYKYFVVNSCSCEIKFFFYLSMLLNDLHLVPERLGLQEIRLVYIGIRMLIQLLLKLLTELFSCLRLSDPHFGLLLESYKFLVHFKRKRVSEKMVVLWSTRAFWKSIGLILLHWRHYCSYEFLVMSFLQAVSKLVLLKILLLLK